jgi:hypothetical protein
MIDPAVTALRVGREALEEAAMTAAEDWGKERTRRRRHRRAAAGTVALDASAGVGGSARNGNRHSRKRDKGGRAKGKGGEVRAPYPML